SKKSALRRCASRSGEPVSMLAVWMETSHQERSGSSLSRWRVPANSLKRPRTVVNIMCLVENSTVEWVGSMVQVLYATVTLHPRDLPPGASMLGAAPPGG